MCVCEREGGWCGGVGGGGGEGGWGVGVSREPPLSSRHPKSDSRWAPVIGLLLGVSVTQGSELSGGAVVCLECPHPPRPPHKTGFLFLAELQLTRI